MTRDEIIREIRLRKELQKRRAKDVFHDFLSYVNPKYDMKWFHKIIADSCQRLYDGETPKLMITVPPQHGKSEIVSRLFPAWVLGKNPDIKIVGCSYSSTLAGTFNRSIQRYMNTDEYKSLFPDTFMNDGSTRAWRGYQCNNEIFETIGHTGYYKAVGVGGSLTGTPADIAIIDDPVKDSMEANSPVARDNVWDWYTTVLSTRLHNESKQMLVMTRWHEDDLAGRILNSPDAKNWLLINIPAICVEDGDGALNSVRVTGDALWPERHSREKLDGERNKDPNNFDCLYQGNPSSAEGRLYSEFKTYVSPEEYGTYVRTGCYVDVADEGSDYSIAISYKVYKSPNTIWNEDKRRMEALLFALVTDVDMTDSNTSITEVSVPNLINRNGVQKAWIESNNGGSQFAKNVQKKVRAQVHPFSQHKNKESRIITNSTRVNQQIIMPFGWERRFPDFYFHVTHFLSKFSANKHDDPEDALTGVYEMDLAEANERAYSSMRRGIKTR